VIMPKTGGNIILFEQLPWLPGPLVTVEHKAKATSRVIRYLRKRAGSRRPHVPETWKSVATEMGLRVVPEFKPGESRGYLGYDPESDTWMIYLNEAYSRIQQAAVLVHELAHFLFREEDGNWLCDEPVVYYYEGSVDEEHHKLSRDVDQTIVQIWESVPEGAGGLFDTGSETQNDQPEGTIFFDQ
jgi:hypothetical protein